MEVFETKLIKAGCDMNTREHITTTLIVWLQAGNTIIIERKDERLLVTSIYAIFSPFFQ